MSEREEPDLDEIERLWVEEAIRRDDEIDRGLVATIPGEEVMARAFARRATRDPGRPGAGDGDGR